MTILILTCHRCFSDYEPTHSDILAGITHWRLCPHCRQNDADQLPAQPVHIGPMKPSPTNPRASPDQEVPQPE